MLTRLRCTIALLSVILVAACSGDSSPSAKAGVDASAAADYVFTNAKV